MGRRYRILLQSCLREVIDDDQQVPQRPSSQAQEGSTRPAFLRHLLARRVIAWSGLLSAQALIIRLPGMYAASVCPRFSSGLWLRVEYSPPIVDGTIIGQGSASKILAAKREAARQTFISMGWINSG